MHSATAIHVAFVVDNRYAQHLGVAIVSLLRNVSAGTKSYLYVVEDGLSDRNRFLLAETAARHGASLAFRSAGGRLGGRLATSGHISQASYYKMLLPKLLADVPSDKVIYLDCDVIVLTDIRELWKTDLRGRVLAAVRDLGGGNRCKELGIDDPSRYFNAGVMVLDLRQWRDRKLDEAVLAYAAANADRLMYHDQDALNAVLHREWLPLDSKWNRQTNMLTRRFRKRNGPPGIVHFTGTSKPWDYDSDHPYKASYFEYLHLTGWSSYKPERGAGVRLKRLVRLLVPRQVIGYAGRVKDQIARRRAAEVTK